MACNFNCRIETEGLVKITGSHMHCKSGNILKTAKDRDEVTTTDH